MNMWNIKIYNKYTQPFLAWLITEFLGSWGIFAILIWGLSYFIYVRRFSFSSFLILFCLSLLSLSIGLFQRSIDVLLFSPSAIWVTKDGIYGKSMFERYFLYFAKPRLLARWEEIGEVVLKNYPLCKRYAYIIGYVEFLKKDGSKFHISYHGFAPTSKGFIFEERKILWNESDKTICLELFGIIAWKVGLDKFKNFPQEEKKASNGVRKTSLSIEGIRRVIQSIEGGGRDELPYKKMDEEWAKEEEENKNGQEAK